MRGGRSVQSGAELQECLIWLCRLTALHYASVNGHTRTAIALVKAGADVHCQDNDGYGVRGCILGSVGLPQCGADGPSTSSVAASSACLAVQGYGAARCVV